MLIGTRTRASFIGLALTAALALAGSANAQAYEWSPQQTVTRLTGTLVFSPSHGAPFQCKVVLNFRTGNVKRGEDSLPQVFGGAVKGRGCESVQLVDLPWYVGPVDPNNVSVSPFGWNGGIESCVAVDGSKFQVMSDGTWVLGGYYPVCLTGSLTSNPPVTIVPRP